MATSSNRLIPCAIGDEVYAVRRNKTKPYICKGTVSQMYFVGKEMKLAIVVSGSTRGEWEKTIFATREEAQRSLERNDQI